jgi:hypothetical protein
MFTLNELQVTDVGYCKVSSLLLCQHYNYEIGRKLTEIND